MLKAGRYLSSWASHSRRLKSWRKPVLGIKQTKPRSSKFVVTPVASVAGGHIRFTVSSAFAEFVSVKWHMPANFQVSPRVLGNNNNDVGPYGYRVEKGDKPMTMTDPIADMLTRVRNANSAHHESVSMPHSKMKEHIAEILKREGYIGSFDITDAQVGKTLNINLKYGPNRERSMAGVRRVSKPGLRVYAKNTALPRVLGGLGIAIISTSTGLLTDKQCAQKGVGGEVLAYVW